MSLIPLTCSQCGAPLEAAESTNYLTCGHCRTRLQVVHTGTSHFTTLLGEIQGQTQGISAELRLMRLEKDLSRLERDWEAWCRKNEVEDLSQIPYADLLHMEAGYRVMSYTVAGLAVVLGVAVHWAFLLAAPVIVFLMQQAGKRQRYRVREFRRNRDVYRKEVETLNAGIQEARSLLPAG